MTIWSTPSVKPYRNCRPSEWRYGRRTFTSARLLEGSVVTFAANPQAFVTAVKSQKSSTFGDYAKAFKALPTFSMPDSCKAPITFEEAYEEFMLKQEIDRFIGKVNAVVARYRK